MRDHECYECGRDCDCGDADDCVACDRCWRKWDAEEDEDYWDDTVDTWEADDDA